MRSMYSAVSGLKTHQTKMDVIGNNIANVNTVAFKSSSVTFRDILYQTTSGASGANVATGIGGVNAKQIGLGVSMATTSVSISTAGASETTGNPFDIKLTDKNTTNFFVVNDGTQNLFTRAGSFYIDGAGNLCMTSTGYMVMGWQVDPTTNAIRKDTVSALRIMQAKNLTSAPEATVNAVMSGVLDENDADVKSDAGKVLNLNFYDDLGYQYTAKFAVKATGTDGRYKVNLNSIIDSNNVDLLAGKTAEEISSLFGTATEKTDSVTLTLDSNAITGGVPGVTASINADGNLVVVDNNNMVPDPNDPDPTNPTLPLVPSPITTIYTYNADYQSFVNGATSYSLKDVFTDDDLIDKLSLTEADLLRGESYKVSVDENGIYSIDHTYLDMDLATVKAFSDTDLKPGFTLEANGNITETATGNVYQFADGLFVNVADINDEKKCIDFFNVPESMADNLGLGLDPTKKNSDYSFQYDNGQYMILKKEPSYDLVFNTANGTFESINGDPSAVTLKLGDAGLVGEVNEKGNFKNISIDFTQCLNYNNSGKSTIGMDSGAVDGTTGKGRKLGNMIGVSIDASGKIFGSYDNGNTELLGQIAIAQFSNASGLEKVGESCYQTTLNSGEFDGIGVEISADGSSMTTGELEMSNVDLSTEFTQMITTQRGFQANSRVITTSDTLLEELVNLKR